MSAWQRGWVFDRRDTLTVRACDWLPLMQEVISVEFDDDKAEHLEIRHMQGGFLRSDVHETREDAIKAGLAWIEAEVDRLMDARVGLDEETLR